ncbi:uncharacterized protein LOC134767465 [Penaeus indicus]|uniref:uncharacterized protein LOC134767465 n=1 Tax=Penaeus indicus TaxID=29960 RepID=UPI00300D9B6E
MGISGFPKYISTSFYLPDTVVLPSYQHKGSNTSINKDQEIFGIFGGMHATSFSLHRTSYCVVRIDHISLSVFSRIMDVSIRCGNTVRCVRVNPEDTIANVKYKAVKLFASKNAQGGFEPGLMFVLSCIWSKVTLSMDLGGNYKSNRGFELSVVTQPFKIIRIAVDAHVGILNLKHQIAWSSEVEVSRQILRAANEVMQDEKTLRDYGIEDHSVIWMDVQPAKKYRLLLGVAANSVLIIGWFLASILCLIFFNYILLQVIECIWIWLCEYILSA